MKANIQSNQNFIITREGEVTDEYDPSGLQLAAQSVLNGLKGAVDHAKLEARMAAFDLLHRTNYRAIRHQLVEQKRRAEFEQSIGLMALR